MRTRASHLTPPPRGWVQRLNAVLRKVPLWLLYIVAILWVLSLFTRGIVGWLGPDPVRMFEHETGRLSLQLVLAALLVSPVRWMTGVDLQRFRRTIGLISFFMALLHVLVWGLLDMQLRWGEILRDLARRPYLLLGLSALLLMAPLAWTSRDSSMRRLGPVRWRRLHLLTYPAAILAAAHFIVVQKLWQLGPILYAVLPLSLLLIKSYRTKD